MPVMGVQGVAAPDTSVEMYSEAESAPTPSFRVPPMSHRPADEADVGGSFHTHVFNVMTGVSAEVTAPAAHIAPVESLLYRILVPS